ncbi:unnamed protein product [Prorocentrum cordatum]|nr:unnamed protein product [Polarella glacialis]
MSAHSMVYTRWFPGDPVGFLVYQGAYSLAAGLLGLALFAALGKPPVEKAAQGGGDGAAAVCARPRSVLDRVRDCCRNAQMPWLAAIFLVPLSYSFALLGMWSTCAARVGMEAGLRARLAVGLGACSALGRILLGGLSDVAPAGRERLGRELCLATGLLAFQLGFACLEWDQGAMLEPALLLQAFGYGGVLALVPAALRASFPAEDLGVVYGLLYQLLAVSFTLFNRAAVPAPGCLGPACFAGWFRAAGLLNAGCLVWSARRCAAASRPRAPSP